MADDRLSQVIDQMIADGQSHEFIMDFVKEAKAKRISSQGWEPAPGGGYQRGYKPPVASNEPPPSFLGEVGTRLGELGQGAKALGELVPVYGHPIDTLGDPAKRRQLLRGVDDSVTLGYGQKAAGAIEDAIPAWARFGEGLNETREADQQKAPEYRTAGNLGAMFTPGAAGYIGKNVGSVMKAAVPAAGVVGKTAQSLLGYGFAAPATAALHADAGSPGDRLAAAGGALADPIGWATAGAGGLASGIVGNAPKRASLSETNALRDRVQYKERLQQFVPREEHIRAELDAAPEVRRTLKASDPGVAQHAVSSKLAQVSDEALEPFYRGLRATGQNIVPGETVVNQLKTARAQFNPWAEAAPIAIVDDLIAKAEDMTAKTGGVDADFLRKTATAYQKQGYANLANFGPIPLSKEVKQAVGGALRGAIADHVESIADDTPSGKALRQAFEDANKRVSTWKAIETLADQMDARAQGNAPATGPSFVEAAHAVKNPLMTAVKGAVSVVPAAADVLDRRVLGPAVESRAGQIASPLANYVTTGAPTVVGGVTNPLLKAAEDKRRRDRENPLMRAQRRQ